MSFQGLISGSECAVGSNPLAQVIKHAESDRSLQQDRLAGPSSATLRHLSGEPSVINQQDALFARQFFEGNPQMNGPPMLSLAEMNELARIGHRPGPLPVASERWALEQPQNMWPLEQNATPSSWVTEFGSSSQTNAVTPGFSQNISEPMRYSGSSLLPQNFQGSSVAFNMYRMTPSLPLYQGETMQGYTGKGKGKEIDFEAAFAQVSESLSQSQSTTSGITEVIDGASGIKDALLEASINNGDAQFSQVWDQLQNSDLPPPKEDMAKWEAEFNQLMSAQREDLDNDYGQAMQSAWEDGLGNFNENFHKETALKFDADGLPMLDAYTFDKDNKYLNPSVSRSHLQDAKDLLERNGSLSEAALLLEAAIQQGELGEGGYETWILLGETRNMDEREDAGMKALMEGVQRAERAGLPGPGMLSLAISFTNESYDRASHSMLLRWLRARYPTVPVSEETIRAVATHSSWDTHNRVTDLFLGLARTQHNKGIVDPDVQTALGVLFYTNGEYDRAKDCFESALSAKPQDYTLWNRLGSSLSNGNQPEEALGAYREALQLRPTYTRAIYNVGVACLNIGAYKEAAEHFLSALNLQETTSGDTSEQLWITLHRALTSMERSDLAALAKPEAKTNLDVFRKQGFEF